MRLEIDTRHLQGAVGVRWGCTPVVRRRSAYTGAG